MWSSDKKYIIVTAIICSSGNFMFWSPFACFWSPVQLLSRFLLYKSKILEITRDLLTGVSSSWPLFIVLVEKVCLDDHNPHTFSQNLHRTMRIWSGIWIPAQFSRHMTSIHAGKHERFGLAITVPGIPTTPQAVSHLFMIIYNEN